MGEPRGHPLATGSGTDPPFDPSGHLAALAFPTLRPEFSVGPSAANNPMPRPLTAQAPLSAQSGEQAGFSLALRVKSAHEAPSPGCASRGRCAPTKSTPRCAPHPPLPPADHPTCSTQKLPDSAPGRQGGCPVAQRRRARSRLPTGSLPHAAQGSSSAEVWPLLGAAIKFGPVPGRPALEVRPGRCNRQGLGAEGGGSVWVPSLGPPPLVAAMGAHGMAKERCGVAPTGP